MDDLELIKATFQVLDECAENIKNAGAGIASIEDNFPKPSNPEWFSDYEDLKSYLDSLKTATGIVGNHFKTFGENLELVSANYKTTESLIEEVGVIPRDDTGNDAGNDTGDGTGDVSTKEGVIVKKGKDYDLDPYDLAIDGKLYTYEGEKIGLDKYYKIDENGNRVSISEEDYKNLGFDKESLRDNIVIFGDGVSAQKALGHYGDMDAFQVDAFEEHAYAQWEWSASSLSAAAGVGGSLIDITGKEQWGNDNYNLHGEYDIKFCAADASACVSLAHGALEAEVGGEVVLASASGSAGGDFAGVDVEVSGSFGIGFGGSVEAKLDLNNGKISIGLSTYVGIGGDFSLELDFSGWVNIAKGWLT